MKRLPFTASAPLTCITIDNKTRTLYAGCWDKHIYAVPLANSSSSTGIQRLANGHTDFIKCLLATSLAGRPVLLSGSADATITLWDISASPPKILHKLKGHTKALQNFAIDPLSVSTKDFVLFSASSDREIRRWHISLDSSYELPESIDHPILAHETSVYSLVFDSDGDLWTASADKTARHLVRERDWAADTTLSHPDFVRDIVISEAAGLVATACRDEEVRVWDAGSGDLVGVYSGHYEEVTGLALIDGGQGIASVGIDGTLRRWSLRREDIARFAEELKTETEQGSGAEASAGAEQGAGMLTAEEEAELAELMDDEE